MTNSWNDIKNTHLIMCIGGNPDEAHPAATHWINEARYRATNPAKLLVVDPRKTRWASKADYFLQIRPGTDIAFFMGVLNYYFSNVAIAGETTYGTGAYNATHHKEVVTVSASTGREFWKDDVSAKVKIDNWPKWTDACFRLNNATWSSATDYERESSPSGGVSNLPKRSTDASLNPILEPATGNPTVWMALKTRASTYTSAVVANICGCSASEFETVAKVICDRSVVAGTGKVATILYAMGLTQHTKGSQNVRAVALLQTVLGNSGRAGGGINAERGIHNVQGSTDMGLLPGNVPGYNVPGMPTASGQTACFDYFDNLFGNPWGNGSTSGASADPTNTTYGSLWQQAGFANLLHQWFKQGSDPYGGSGCPTLTSNFNLMAAPQINASGAAWAGGAAFTGLNHRDMFREAGNPSSTFKTLVSWGMNSAQTDSNTTRVMKGLYELDNLIVVDVFLTETADAGRKTNAPTYLLPASMFVEKAGSTSNSSRWIQWRDQGVRPKGRSKPDLQILLDLVKGMSDKGAFSWIPSYSYATHWGTQYGYTPAGTLPDTSDWWPTAGPSGTTGTSETVCDNVFKEIADGTNTGSAAVNAPTYNGTLWIYRGAYNSGGFGGYSPGTTLGWWHQNNAAKSRNPNDVNVAGTGAATTKPWDNASTGTSTLGLYGRWCFAWLQDRHIFYNNGTVAGDISDIVVAPDQVARLWVHKKGQNPDLQYPWVYRDYNTLVETDAKFPRHVEALETNRTDLDQYSTWGAPAAKIAEVVYAGDGTYNRADFPLILSTIRDVVHFQGGPLTRNVPYLVELSPVANIEIHAGDAAARGISTGDNVYIKTARSVKAAAEVGLGNWPSHPAMYSSAKQWIGPFKAVVKSNSPMQGVVAVPFHWGPKGLGTGPTANLLCIDALDGNTSMQESKYALCEITKTPS